MSNKLVYKRSQMSFSFYWYDLETSGINPKTDRILQFAGIRTDADFNIIGDKQVFYSQISDDILLSPEASLVTKLTPQLVNEKGIKEGEFIKKILKEFETRETCVLGYNTIRFDDEFIRYSLYRNLYDPYSREWQNGNTRWDLIDCIRMTSALRPEGINWPIDSTGKLSYKLENLSKENDIIHELAHDALSDVEATIGLAKLISEKQNKLFKFLFNLRRKQEVLKYIDLNGYSPIVHSTGMVGSEFYCTSVFMPLSQHPNNSNGIIAWDLRYDPKFLLEFSSEQIKDSLYTKTDELEDPLHKMRLKLISINKCPAIAPMSTLDENSQKKIKIDMNLVKKHYDFIYENREEIIPKLYDVYNDNFESNDINKNQNNDVDGMLYNGFLDRTDKMTMQKLHKNYFKNFRAADFEDERLSELGFRYVARNYTDNLDKNELNKWKEYCKSKLINIDAYIQNINALIDNEKKQKNKENLNVLIELKDYAVNLKESYF